MVRVPTMRCSRVAHCACIICAIVLITDVRASAHTSTPLGIVIITAFKMFLCNHICHLKIYYKPADGRKNKCIPVAITLTLKFNPRMSTLSWHSANTHTRNGQRVLQMRRLHPYFILATMLNNTAVIRQRKRNETKN